ncbi:MAG: dockerin type I repeat-containing protein [Clostridia bacterium]|nr:dockerin type I repeat-containing protein [Clostridia bacterium]
MKKRIGIVTLVFVLATMVCLPTLASAEQATAPGFYNFGTATGVTVTPKDANGAVTAVTADVNGDSTDDTFYPNANKFTVNYTGATKDAYYGVLLADGDAAPTKESEIFYIDQLTAEGNSIDFLVYPILSKENNKQTLYISSSVEGAPLVKVPLYYTTAGTYGDDEPDYVLGNVNGDAYINSSDALKVLQIASGSYTPTETERLAANVNGDAYINSGDSLKILQFAAGTIDSWN